MKGRKRDVLVASICHFASHNLDCSPATKFSSGESQYQLMIEFAHLAPSAPPMHRLAIIPNRDLLNPKETIETAKPAIPAKMNQHDIPDNQEQLKLTKQNNWLASKRVGKIPTWKN
jgi:hypothetical protein